MAWGGGFRSGEAKVENRVIGGIAGLDAGFGFVDFHAAPPRVAGGENGGEKSLEFRAGDGVLVGFKHAPIRRRGEHRKAALLGFCRLVNVL